jgi:hypothetical protein
MAGQVASPLANAVLERWENSHHEFVSRYFSRHDVFSENSVLH